MLEVMCLETPHHLPQRRLPDPNPCAVCGAHSHSVSCFAEHAHCHVRRNLRQCYGAVSGDMDAATSRLDVVNRARTLFLPSTGFACARLQGFAQRTRQAQDYFAFDGRTVAAREFFAAVRFLTLEENMWYRVSPLIFLASHLAISCLLAAAHTIGSTFAVACALLSAQTTRRS